MNDKTQLESRDKQINALIEDSYPRGWLANDPEPPNAKTEKYWLSIGIRKGIAWADTNPPERLTHHEDDDFHRTKIWDLEQKVEEEDEARNVALDHFSKSEGYMWGERQNDFIKGWKARASKPPKERDEEAIMKVIREWKHYWMNQRQNSEEDYQNYLNRASGIDSNMIHHLAKLIVRNSGQTEQVAEPKGSQAARQWSTAVSVDWINDQGVRKTTSFGQKICLRQVLEEDK